MQDWPSHDADPGGFSWGEQVYGGLHSLDPGHSVPAFAMCPLCASLHVHSV